MPDDMMMADIEKINALVGNARVDLSDEKRTQNELADVFKSGGLSFQKEFRLCDRDIPDFMINGIAIEVKLRGHRKKSVYKQIARYAAHQRVKAVILVSNMSMGLPDDIEGTPIYFIPLGRGWL